jgi:hypothetical protein
VGCSMESWGWFVVPEWLVSGQCNGGPGLRGFVRKVDRVILRVWWGQKDRDGAVLFVCILNCQVGEIHYKWRVLVLRVCGLVP